MYKKLNTFPVFSVKGREKQVKTIKKYLQGSSMFWCHPSL